MTVAAFIPASSTPLLPPRAGSSFTPGVSPISNNPDNEPDAPPTASAQTTAVASNEFFKSVADSIRRKQAEAAKHAPKPRAPTDLHTMTELCDFLPPFRATVAAVEPLTKHRDYVQLTIDVSAIPELLDAHDAPAQSIHLSRMPAHAAKRHPGAVQAVIASPPQSGPMLDFLISRAADPAKLTSLKPGDPIAIGPVSGPALSVSAHLEARANLLFFADSPQAFAAVRSLVEWDFFRAMSGSGANRTSSVTVFYALPSHQSIPYSDRFSKWSVFGVNIVPIVAPTSLLDYLKERNSLGGSLGLYDAKAASTAVAIVAARSNAEYETFFMHLIRLGLRRNAIDRISADDIAAGGRNTAHQMPASSASSAATSAPSPSAPRPSVSPQPGTPRPNHATRPAHAHTGVPHPRGMPDAVFDEMRRMQLEREIWAEWVKLREELRKELQNELNERRRLERTSNRAAEDQRVAWQGWMMRNREQWGQDAWDNDAWQTYWESWGKPRDEESAQTGPGFGHGAKAWNSGGFDGAHRGNRQWNQQDSEEYWDWVGRGAGKSGSAGGGAGRSQNYSTYSDQYSGYGSWGNDNNQNQWSGYQKSGYKYQYEETEEDRKQHQKGHGAGAGTGPGGDWWSGWRKQNQNSRSGSNRWYSRSGASGAGPGGSRSGGGGGGGRYGQRSRQGDNLDLYGILGISSTASRAEIKKAYRKKAMDHHPDRNPERKDEAHVVMKKIVTAWTVLKDDGRRRTYDQTGVAGF